MGKFKVEKEQCPFHQKRGKSICTSLVILVESFGLIFSRYILVFLHQTLKECKYWHWCRHSCNICFFLEKSEIGCKMLLLRLQKASDKRRGAGPLWANALYVLRFIVRCTLVTGSFTLVKLIKPREVSGFVQYFFCSYFCLINWEKSPSKFI